jgi:hypothetical protein
VVGVLLTSEERLESDESACRKAENPSGCRVVAEEARRASGCTGQGGSASGDVMHGLVPPGHGPGVVPVGPCCGCPFSRLVAQRHVSVRCGARVMDYAMESGPRPHTILPHRRYKRHAARWQGTFGPSNSGQVPECPGWDSNPHALAGSRV